MAVPLHYNFRSLFYRKTATCLTILAVALTVAVLVMLMSVQQGFSKAMTTTGREDNVVCIRKGATSEGESSITRDDFNRLRGSSRIAIDVDGEPMISAEMYAGVTLARISGGPTNVSLRGVQPMSFRVREVEVAEGRAFRPGVRELVVGRSLSRRIRGCRIGGTIRIGKDEWPVVGIMDAGGTAFDSEIWGDVEAIVQAFNYDWYTTAIARAKSADDVGEAAIYIKGNQLEKPGRGLVGQITERVARIEAMPEPTYFAGQAGFLGGTLFALTVFLTTLMSFGALAGCTNTLLAAVAGRTREIGGLLAIGFRPWQVFVGFLVESLLLSLIGAGVGILLTLPLNGLQTGTTNWQTFTEQAFSFEVNATVIMTAICLALAVGIIGGVLPAWRASRLKPVDALRR